MADTSNTIKARIAVAVDKNGVFRATGVHPGQDDFEVFSWILDDLEPGEARYFVEVELAVPTVTTVQATATPAQALTVLIDRVHGALRCVDAADLSAPLRLAEINKVSDAVQAVETFARENGIKLSEFAR